MKKIVLFLSIVCLSTVACTKTRVRTEIVPGPTKFIYREPPSEFLVIRPPPTLRNDEVESYIEYGLECKAILEKKNADTQSIIDWLTSVKE